jgi:hypothetical protein
MTLPSRPRLLLIPAKAGIHLSARKFLPDSHEHRGSSPIRSLAPPWIPAFAGMAGLFGQAWANA